MKKLTTLLFMIVSLIGYSQTQTSTAYKVVVDIIQDTTEFNSIENKRGAVVFSVNQNAVYTATGSEWIELLQVQTNGISLASADSLSNLISKAKIDSTFGWVSYMDTAYTSKTDSIQVAGGSDQRIPFYAGSSISTYLPIGIDSLWSNTDSTIVGIDGTAIDVMFYFRATPTAANQWLEVWVDIGGGVGELYRQTFSFPRGAGVERGILYALPSAYTLNTWEANGGKLYLRSNAAIKIHSMNLNIDVDLINR